MALKTFSYSFRVLFASNRLLVGEILDTTSRFGNSVRRLRGTPLLVILIVVVYYGKGFSSKLGMVETDHGTWSYDHSTWVIWKQDLIEIFF